ncbi:MAG: hypothetical protein WBB73_00140 [Candidatus Aminicenantaceae bacterium]
MAFSHLKYGYPLFRTVCALLSIWILTPELPAQTQSPTSAEDAALLKQVMQKTGDYCERLKAVALDFICHENMLENTYFYNKKSSYRRSDVAGDMVFSTQLQLRRVQDKTYVYDYQMIRKEEERHEKRDLLEENGKKKEKKDAKLELQRYFAQYLVYGPVGFLSHYWQQHFDYSIVGREALEGRETLVITATPTEEREENYSFGKIWVDAVDFSVLKIEWDPRSIPGYSEELDSSIGHLRREITWTVTYGTEKNGIRFPSFQKLEEMLINHTGNRSPKYEVIISYDHYQFFIVETEIKY